MATLGETLAELENAGLEIRRGVPATDEQIAELEEAVGCTFPEDYVAFLKEFGALRAGKRLNVFGHAPEDPDLDVVAASKIVLEGFERWGQEPSLVAVFFGTQHFPSECQGVRLPRKSHRVLARPLGDKGPNIPIGGGEEIHVAVWRSGTGRGEGDLRARSI